MRRMLVLTTLCWMTACGSGESTSNAKVEDAKVAEAAPEAPAKLEEVDEYKVLAPSPLDFERTLKEVGLADHLKGAVPDNMPSSEGVSDKDLVAFQTGVKMSWTLLGGRDTDKDTFVKQVREVRDGMATIGTGEGLLKTMDRAIEQVVNDTASRADFLEEFDAQVSMMVPEEGFGPSDTTGPMLQAGAWLGSINVVAGAIVNSGNAEAADKMLHRGDVAEYYLRYLATEEGSEKAGPMGERVRKVLVSLKDISGRETIGIDGAREAHALTAGLLDVR